MGIDPDVTVELEAIRAELADIKTRLQAEEAETGDDGGLRQAEIAFWKALATKLDGTDNAAQKAVYDALTTSLGS